MTNTTSLNKYIITSAILILSYFIFNSIYISWDSFHLLLFYNTVITTNDVSVWTNRTDVLMLFYKLLAFYNIFSKTFYLCRFANPFCRYYSINSNNRLFYLILSISIETNNQIIFISIIVYFLYFHYTIFYSFYDYFPNPF